MVGNALITTLGKRVGVAVDKAYQKTLLPILWFTETSGFLPHTFNRLLRHPKCEGVGAILLCRTPHGYCISRIVK